MGAFQGFQDSTIMKDNILLSTTRKTSVTKGFRRFSENRLAQSDARGLCIDLHAQIRLVAGICPDTLSFLA